MACSRAYGLALDARRWCCVRDAIRPSILLIPLTQPVHPGHFQPPLLYDRRLYPLIHGHTHPRHPYPGSMAFLSLCCPDLLSPVARSSVLGSFQPLHPPCSPLVPRPSWTRASDPAAACLLLLPAAYPQLQMQAALLPFGDNDIISPVAVGRFRRRSREVCFCVDLSIA